MQISQAKQILLQQNSEWSKVMAEESERQSLLKYGTVLTVVAYLMSFIGSAFVLGFVSAFVPYSMTYYLVSSVLQLGLSLVFLYAVPQLLAAIAPSFGGKNDSLSALKLYVFTMTPVWVGMMASIVPVIGWIAVFAGAVYGIYLFWNHVAEAMNIPADKKIGYTLVSIIAIGVIGFVISAAAHAVAGAFFVTTVVRPHFGF